MKRRDVVIELDRVVIDGAPSDPAGLRFAVARGLARALRHAPARVPVRAIAERAGAAIAASTATACTPADDGADES